MRPRQITRCGWSVEDDLRADRIAAKRGPATAYEELRRMQWEGQPTPWFEMFGARVSTTSEAGLTVHRLARRGARPLHVEHGKDDE